jgi:hypothetical protein
MALSRRTAHALPGLTGQPGTFPAAIESSASKARFLLQALAHGDWLTITETSFEPHETNNNANPQRISHRDEAADRMSPGSPQRAGLACALSQWRGSGCLTSAT